jgi:DNA (cytosine-5)-methyltransferase 1
MREYSNGLVTDHICREHNEQDLEAFELMPQGGIYADLPDHLKRYRDDIFPDKYRKLKWNGVAGTITAHMAKDCYTHIHPSQPRTISIREAARLQSFPDDFRFYGNMGDRFRQIGNAVPPLMSWGIAEFVGERLEEWLGI